MQLQQPHVKARRLSGDDEGWWLFPLMVERCPWCQKKRGVSDLEFYSVAGFWSEREAYRLAYPARGECVVAAVAHEHCGPCAGADFPPGYVVALDDLAEDPNGWYRHLLTKTWAPSFLKGVIYDVLLLHRKQAYSRFYP